MVLGSIINNIQPAMNRLTFCLNYYWYARVCSNLCIDGSTI
jgi:hypothetical protein